MNRVMLMSILGTTIGVALGILTATQIQKLLTKKA